MAKIDGKIEKIRRLKQSETRKRLFKEGKLRAWNKGLTKETNQTVKKWAKERETIKNPNWKGGKIKTREGYVWVSKKSHPNCNSRGYVKEHRLNMERYLGRYLTGLEEIHHVNENKSDNRIINLQLFENHGVHQKYHEELKRLKKSK